MRAGEPPSPAPMRVEKPPSPAAGRVAPGETGCADTGSDEGGAVGVTAAACGGRAADDGGGGVMTVGPSPGAVPATSPVQAAPAGSTSRPEAPRLRTVGG